MACEKCGPSLQLTDMSGLQLANREAAVVLTKQLLKDGAIVAVKGIGGYHLVCDARNNETVTRLRHRKRRPKRPLAVMACSLDSCEKIGILSSDEKELLTSMERPIVVVRQNADNDLASEIAPNMCTFGLMLPYTPLHHLLLEDDELVFVVMTSANPSGHPILYRDDEVLSSLASVADYILTHNREIVHPIEDSVVQWKESGLEFLRRGRGYVPDPYETLHDVDGFVALGGQQKNTVTFGRGTQLFVGPPNGDLTNLDIERHGQEEYGQFVQLSGVFPHTAAVDLHPGYTTRVLVSDPSIEFVSVQHHHAHHVSCMEDNGLTGDCYGLILDGTGYGTDGCIWGFELLYGNAGAVERLGHLRYTPLPGGELCVKQPWRSAVAMVLSLLPQCGEAWLRRLYPSKDHEIDLIRTMIEKQINAPLAGTCGRLFDAVSSLLGLCHVSTYDGEAAIVLSELASYYEGEEVAAYPYSIDKVGSLFEISCSRMLEEIIQSILGGVPVAEIAVRFHETVAAAAVNLLLHTHEEHSGNVKEVVLSGGSLHNRYLSAKLRSKLERQGFEVYEHRRVPCSDSGISQGQIIIAAHQKHNDHN
nr:carbamoyltransferase HypF [Paenibacillus foliorum]